MNDPAHFAGAAFFLEVWAAAKAAPAVWAVKDLRAVLLFIATVFRQFGQMVNYVRGNCCA
jgi:hypothetical protein